MWWVPNSAPDISALPPWFDAAMIDALADAVATRIADRLSLQSEREPRPGWLDAHKAAIYLDVPYSTFRKHTAAGRITGQQDVRDGRLYFKPDDLDDWRRSGPHSA